MRSQYILTKNKGNTTLYISFFATVTIFLLFLGGAVKMTLSESAIRESMRASGPLDKINWLWIPTIMSLLFTLVVGWVLFERERLYPKKRVKKE